MTRHRFGLLALLLTVSQLLWETANCDEVSDQRAAIVRIGGCSGVCVHPTGLVMTAKHCGLGDNETVTFQDKAVSAKRIYMAAGTEGPLVYDCEGDGFPFVAVGETVPPPGSAASTMGFPNIKGKRVFRQASGTVIRGGEFKYHGQVFLGNVTNMVTGPGWSGGPLLNETGKVVGLLNSGDKNSTVFISFAATRKAYDAVAPKRFVRKPILYVFTQDGCRGCERFKQDYERNAAFRSQLNARYRVQFVDVRERPDLVKKYQVRSVPAFIAAAETAFKIIDIGYRGIQAILGRLLGSDSVKEISAPVDQTDVSPVAEPEVDWSKVAVIVLAAKQDVGRVQGAVRSKLIGLATGPLQRLVAEKTDNKATLVIVAERTKPSRFAAVTEAAGIEVERFYSVVLVAKQPLGLKALIAGRVERIVAEKLRDTPVDVIFQRAHPDAYAAVTKAIKTDEPAVQGATTEEPTLPAPRPPMRFPFQESAIGGLVAMLTERLKLVRKVREWRAAV